MKPHNAIRREWTELGGELRRLRKSRGLGQKEVLALLGEVLSERTLGAYERGEQPTSRSRLLRFATKVFELKEPEINDLLKLAGYAQLTEKEILRHGLATSAATPLSNAAAGPPAAFRIEVGTLIVVDAEGRELWRHRFPSRLEPGSYSDVHLARRCVFADIDGDGGIETLFVYVPLEFTEVGTTLFCFSVDGSVRWQFEPGRQIRDTRQEYLPPYYISTIAVIPVKAVGTRILVSSNHYLHNPNQVAILDSDGRLVSEYWHSGHLYSVAHADINGDGVEEILLGGVNNGYRLGTLVIFDSRNVAGASSQPGRQILGFPAGTEKVVVLFPRSCVSEDASYTRVSELRITRERRIVVVVTEGVSEARNPGVMIYELDFDLNVVNCRPDSHLRDAHRALEIQGQVDHSWTEEENERLRRAVIIIRREP